MSATYCLGPFAARIRSMPREGWKAELEKLPERCPRGCGVNCRTYCASYARIQWRMALMREKAVAE